MEIGQELCGKVPGRKTDGGGGMREVKRTWARRGQIGLPI